jgi:hypothetical protein
MVEYDRLNYLRRKLQKAKVELAKRDELVSIHQRRHIVATERPERLVSFSVKSDSRTGSRARTPTTTGATCSKRSGGVTIPAGR